MGKCPFTTAALSIEAVKIDLVFRLHSLKVSLISYAIGVINLPVVKILSKERKMIDNIMFFVSGKPNTLIIFNHLEITLFRLQCI